MAVSGTGALYDVEIIAIGQEEVGKNCSKPADFTISKYWMAGGYVGSEPLVCGGDRNDKCFSYSFERNAWQLENSLDYVEVAGLASHALDDNRLWLTGGRIPGNNYQAATYIVQGGQDTPGPDLPYATAFHCIVKLNDTHSFLNGGYMAGVANTNEASAYLYSWETQEWTSVGQTEKARRGHTCAVLENPKRIMVIGGFSSGEESRVLETDTEILDLESLTWSTGPPTPGGRSFYGGAAIPYNGSFVLIGGGTGPSFKSIYSLETESMTWVELEETMETPREFFAAIQIPNNACRAD